MPEIYERIDRALSEIGKLGVRDPEITLNWWHGEALRFMNGRVSDDGPHTYRGFKLSISKISKVSDVSGYDNDKKFHRIEIGAEK